jgi:hypothetical protein
VDEFGYLSVITSVIIGLSITQLLQGIGQVINARDRVPIYWPTMAWTILLLVVNTQAWWVMFSLRNKQSWTFVQFTIVLLEAIMLYLLAAIVLPNIPDEGQVDLRSNYFPARRLVFRFARCSPFGQPVKERCCFLRFTWKNRSRVSLVLDYNCVNRGFCAQRALSQGICLPQLRSVHRVHRAAFPLAALTIETIDQCKRRTRINR